MSDWLDMTRYPNLAPDDAVPGATLSELRGVLFGHEVTPLADGPWHAALGAATGTGEPADSAAGDVAAGDVATGGGWGDGHLGSWWLEHQPDDGADHHPLSELPDATDPHDDGGHW